ncbi:Holliday junction branch migration protein RuvA [uncultured Campylobacter sp.]|uniref:Holliday junction branch migration protein RuvA n=1 Tax=uncultured Campylobacter sp. TaxID=218934 RepID=UPI0026241FC0|nr:Holliday junction branch migration protein RuvA [uncultured Campylobacter sp.]
MIVEIEGILTKLEPTMAVIKLSSGISYGVIISLNCSLVLKEGQKTALIVKQIVREDANLLYGFKDSDEKMMFELLLKVSGVGASTAMAVCSTLNFSDFTSAIVNGDIKVLTQVPGIGQKTARKMVAELSDAKLIGNESLESYKSQSIMALESLGFKKDRILKVLSTCKSKNTADLIKEALKKLA